MEPELGEAPSWRRSLSAIFCFRTSESPRPSALRDAYANPSSTWATELVAALPSPPGSLNGPCHDDTAAAEAQGSASALFTRSPKEHAGPTSSPPETPAAAKPSRPPCRRPPSRPKASAYMKATARRHPQPPTTGGDASARDGCQSKEGPHVVPPELLEYDWERRVAWGTEVGAASLERRTAKATGGPDGRSRDSSAGQQRRTLVPNA